MNNIIVSLTQAIMMHNALMKEFQKHNMQGLKRFNRYESIEMLKRLNKIENHAIEYDHKLIDSSITYSLPQNLKVTDMLIMIRNNRADLQKMLMNAKNEASEIKLYDIYIEIIEDLEKEWEIFNRIIKKMDIYTSADSKYMVAFEFDKDMHEYMKNKEKK